MEALDLSFIDPNGAPKTQLGLRDQKEGRAEKPNFFPALKWLARAVVIILVVGALSLWPGCRAKNFGAPAEDPALTALGQASIKIMEERMKSPFITLAPTGETGSVLSRAFVLEGQFSGSATEVLIGITRAINYGLWVKNARAGRLPIVIEPDKSGQTMLWLIGDLNRQLKKDRAAIGIDSVNKRLTLSASEVDR
jgi:hypothetical protein